MLFARHPVKIVLPAQQRECGDEVECPLSTAPAGQRNTCIERFERYAYELSELVPIEDVANHLGVGCDTVRDIRERYGHKSLPRPRFRDLTHVAIDDIRPEDGCRHLTVMLDLKTGAVLSFAKTNGIGSLGPLWKKLRRAGMQLEAVATGVCRRLAFRECWTSCPYRTERATVRA